VIHIEALAPAKPALGAICNGCGVCCLSEPCPLGMLLSRRRHGRCIALRWDEPGSRYRCGMVIGPAAAAAHGRQGTAPWFTRAVSRLARRWIAAGAGCDSSVTAERLPA